MPGFDDIKDKGLLSNRGEDLLRQRKRRMQQKSVEETRFVSDLVKEIEGLNKVYDDFDSMVEQNNNEMIKRIQDTRKNIERARRAHAANVQKSFFGGVSTQLGPRSTTEDITSVARSSSGLGGAISTARTTSTVDLETQIARGRRQLELQRERILETAAGIDEPGNQSKFKLQMGARERVIQSIGSAEAALRTQRKLGLDTSSQYYRAADATRRIQSDRERYQIAEDVSAGRTGDRGQVQEDLNRIGKQLIDTFGKLDEAVKTNSADASKLSEEFRKLDEQYSRASQTAAEMDRQGGYDRFRTLSDRFGMIGDAGVATQGVAQGYRYNMITSEMAATQQRMGLANLTNQRYLDQRGAAGGDASALRRVLSDTFERQARRAEEFGARETMALGGEAVGKGLQLGGSVGSAFIGQAASAIPGLGAAGKRFGQGSGMQKFGGPMGTIAGALPGVAAAGTADALQLNQMITDLRKNIAPSAAAIAAAQQQRELENIMNIIPDMANQQMIDTLKGTTLSTRGLGVGGVTGGIADIVGGIGGLGGRQINTDVLTDIETRRMGPDSDMLKGVSKPGRRRGALDFIEGKRARAAERGFFGTLGDSIGLGPSREELIMRGREIRQGEMDPVTGTHGTLDTSIVTPGQTKREDIQSGIQRSLTDRESLQRLLLNPANREALARAGLQGDALNQVIGAGVGGLGKEMMGQGGLNAAMSAGQFSQAGYFQSPGQYMQARAALTTVGGGADDLENIMRDAVASGMDSSKNIMEMVTATQALASTSATAGIDAVSGAGAALGRGVRSLRNIGVSANMATAAARQGVQTAEGFGTDAGLDIFNVMEFAELRQEFQGAELYQLEALQTADPKELETLYQVFEKQGREEGRKRATSMGLGVLTSKEDVRRAQETTRRQIGRRQVGLGINRPLEQQHERLLEQGMTLDEMPTEVQDFVNARTRMTAGRGTSGVAVSAAAQFARGRAGEGETLARGGIGTTTRSGEEALAAPGISASKEFAAAVGNFKNHIDGLASIGPILSKLAELDPDKFASATQKAAENMELPASQFSENMVQFNGAIGRFTNEINRVVDKLKGTVGGTGDGLRNQGGTGAARRPGNK